MSAKQDFEFLNSPTWLQYTQVHYLTPEEMRYRLQQERALPSDWKEISSKIINTRKLGSVPLFISSIDKKFWFFPSDALIRKVNEIEKLGLDLHTTISKHASFKQDFFLDSTIEEAITSAIYEGAHTTRAQAQQLIASGQKPRSKDEWMLINNLNAMKWVQENREKPITQELVLELHKKVTEKTMHEADASFSGKFRDGKVFVGPHEGVLHSAIEPTLAEAILLTTRNSRYIHPLIQGILFHYFIAYIHPFFDGNGRTARALFYFTAMGNRLDYVQLLSVSAYLKEKGTQYQKAFEKVVSNELDVTYFIDFCLESIHSALKQVSQKTTYLLSILELKAPLELSSNQVGLLQRMALHKFRTISIQEYSLQIGKSREVARQELKGLKSLRLLLEVKQGKKLVYKIDKERLSALIKNPQG